MTEERFDFYGKRAQSFLGVSRWTIRDYRRRGLLPNRTRFSEAELRACLDGLKPRERPGAAERINVPRAKKNATATKMLAKEDAAPQRGTAPQAKAPEEPRSQGGENAPSPAPTSPPSSGGACAGDPHHLEFVAPQKKADPKASASEPKATPEKKPDEEPAKGEVTSDGWDCSL